jgi:hypothetical protein
LIGDRNSQPERRQARILLPRFAEGFGTLDLKSAKVLFDELQPWP